MALKNRDYMKRDKETFEIYNKMLYSINNVPTGNVFDHVTLTKDFLNAYTGKVISERTDKIKKTTAWKMVRNLINHWHAAGVIKKHRGRKNTYVKTKYKLHKII